MVLATCMIGAGWAGAATSDQLISEAKHFDGQEVVYEGELIGAVLGRGAFAWLNLNDNKNAIGVWMPRELAVAVRHAGSHNMRGDWLAVAGIFHRACAEHGGGLDIHARAVAVVEEGGSITETISFQKILWVGILFGVLACLLIIHIFVQRRSSK